MSWAALSELVAMEVCLRITAVNNSESQRTRDPPWL